MSSRLNGTLVIQLNKTESLNKRINMTFLHRYD